MEERKIIDVNKAICSFVYFLISLYKNKIENNVIKMFRDEIIYSIFCLDTLDINQIKLVNKG